MSRYFTAWATVLLLMIAAIRDLSGDIHQHSTPPAAPIAAPAGSGIGVAFLPTPRGALVRYATQGTPAASMGLEPGDVIISVNGTPLAGRNDTEMRALIQGREGSDIALGIIDVRTGTLLSRRSRRGALRIPG
jgi:S1-C subfamily serine protease